MFRSIIFICLLTKLMVQWLLVSDKVYLLSNELVGDKVEVIQQPS